MIEITPPDEPYTGVGSLQYSLIYGLDALIAEKVPSTTSPLFSTQDHSTPSYTRNVNNWAAAHVQALTAISPWNSDGEFRRAGTLISPRHVMFAPHYYPTISSTIRFVTADNTVVTRTISGIVPITDPDSPPTPDLLVAILDSDVPSSISFARVLPNNFEQRLSTNQQAARIPCAFTDQEEKLLVVDVLKVSAETDPDIYDSIYCRMQTPTSALRLAFNELLVGGDSGNPAFWFIDGSLVLLTVWTGAENGGVGTSLAAYRTEINDAMTTLGGGYQLTEVDLSGFLIS